MSANVIALLYLAAAVLFIMALRGLSSPETSRAATCSASPAWDRHRHHAGPDRSAGGAADLGADPRRHRLGGAIGAVTARQVP